MRHEVKLETVPLSECIYSTVIPNNFHAEIASRPFTNAKVRKESYTRIESSVKSKQAIYDDSYDMSRLKM